MKKILTLKNVFIVYFVFLVAGITMVEMKNRPKTKDICYQIKTYFSSISCNGMISEKYIDKQNHSDNTIIVVENDIEKTFFLDFEIGGMYDFLEIGDSIVKNKQQLSIRIIRGSMDTVLTFKYNCN